MKSIEQGKKQRKYREKKRKEKQNKERIEKKTDEVGIIFNRRNK